MAVNSSNLEVAALNSGGEESQIIEGARRGEEKAFERIFQQHKDRVFSICLRMTGNYYEAEDLLQETFILVFKHIRGFRGNSSLSTWLYRVTVNVVIDSFRKRNPRLDWSAEEPSEQELSVLAGGVPGADLTLDRLRLERAIAALPTGYRTVLVLHDVEGYSHDEIAQWLGSSSGTCKSQLHKARRKLRDMLSRN